MINKCKITIKGIKYRNFYLVILISILWITSSVMAIKSLTKPIMIDEVITKLMVEQKTEFNYFAQVKSSTLYPTGGRVEFEDIMLTTLTDKLIVNLNHQIESDNPIFIEGMAEVVLTVQAKDLWEKEYYKTIQKPFNLEGKSDNIFEEEIHIDINDVLYFIKTIEDEISIRPGNYILRISPSFNAGEVKFEGQALELVNNNASIEFEISNQYIRYAGEPERQFELINKVEETRQVKQTVALLVIKLPVKVARYLFIMLSIISSVALFSMCKKIKITSWKNTISFEYQLIDKKYKNRLVHACDRLNFDNTTKIALRSFNDLLKIADEKEEPILRYENYLDNGIYYLIMGEGVTYYYRIPMQMEVR